MKICIFSPYSANGAISGTFVRLEMLAKALNNLGFEVHIIGPFPGIDGAISHFYTLDLPIYKRIYSSVRARHLINSISPDILILEAPLLSIKLNTKVTVQMIHDSKFATSYRRSGGWILWLYYLFFSRVRNATVTVSDAERSNISKYLMLNPKKIIVSKNGISNGWLEQKGHNSLKKYDVLYVSNFAPHKGHLRLLKCLRNANLKIAFVGRDLGALVPVKEFVDRERMDVTFLSDLDTDELINTYDSSKVFMFPSELEGFGIPFVEARSRGLPVIASEIEVFFDLSRKLGGCTVNFDDCELVLKKVHSVLDSPPDVPDLREFMWMSIAKLLISELEILLPQVENLEKRK
jgi:glycosyltransferase involved in cell wall biosynthesis